MTALPSNFVPSKSPPSGVARSTHRDVLIMAALVLIGSFSLRLVGTDRVAFFFAPHHPLPTICMSRAWLGIDCPGCGLTRSFVCLAQGRWRASLAYHPLGWVMAALVLVQFPYRLACLSGMRPLPRAWTAPIAWILTALLIGTWIAKFV
jgi:hypothetical protein